MKNYAKKIIACIFILSSFLLIRESRIYALSKADSIAVVGDSISVTASYTYPTVLQNSYAFSNVDSFATTSAQTSAMITQLNNNVIGHGYKGVIVLGGVNDIAAGQSSSTIQNNLNTIYSTAKANGLEVVAIPILPWGCYPTSSPTKMATTKSINQWIQANSNVDYFIDIYNSMVVANDCMNPSYTDDGLHPNPTGHQLIAQAIAQALSSSPTPTVSPSPSPSPTSSPSPTQSPSPTASITGTPTPSLSPSPTGYITTLTPTATQTYLTPTADDTKPGELPETSLNTSSINNMLIGLISISIGIYLNRYKLKQKGL